MIGLVNITSHYTHENVLLWKFQYELYSVTMSAENYDLLPEYLQVQIIINTPYGSWGMWHSVSASDFYSETPGQMEEMASMMTKITVKNYELIHDGR